ncbi:MAG: zinc ABC transporter substrate-binding protein [Planctomycetota bacterium]
MRTSAAFLALLAALAALFAVAGGLWRHGRGPAATDGEPGERPLRRVLCTIYPLHLLARAVVAGREGVGVERMLPARMGCPHDYVPTPQDVRALQAADVLVVNGGGLDDFLAGRREALAPELVVIDGSRGILAAGEGAATDAHLCASPRQAARVAANLAAGLAAADPGGAELYARNAAALAARLDALAGELAARGERLANRRVVVQHAAFDHLARDIGLEIVGIVAGHAGQEPAAAEMLAIVARIRAAGAGAVCTEPQYPSEIGRTIAAEAGVPVVVLDPVATGPEEAGLDHYEAVMRRNMAALEEALGAKR